MWLVRPVLVFLVFLVAEGDGFRHGGKRAAAFFDSFPRLSRRTSKPLQIADDIVQPGFGGIQKPVPALREEEKGESRPDSGPREYFRRLRLVVQDALLGRFDSRHNVVQSGA
jgi:hypothetical protein